MQTVSIEQLIMTITPVYSGSACTVLILQHLPVWKRLKGSGMRQTLFFYYALTTFNWSMLVLFSFNPRKFMLFSPLFIYSSLIVPILLYQFIFILTRADNRERFSPLHYIPPAVLIVLYQIGSLHVSHETMGQLSFKHPQFLSGSGLHTLLILLAVLRLLYGFFYSILSILRYRRYRRIIEDYSSDLYLSSLYWLRIFLILWVGLLVIPVFGMFGSPNLLLTQLRLVIPAALLFAQHILLCFNVIQGNYSFIAYNPQLFSPHSPENDKRQLQKRTLSNHLENYKPFLNPQLTIIDMANELRTNRTYLSSFINKTYGMNFSQFINECRLNELERIIADPKHAEKGNLEKINLAGFGSYPAYRHAVKMHEKRKILMRSR